MQTAAWCGIMFDTEVFRVLITAGTGVEGFDNLAFEIEEYGVRESEIINNAYLC